MKKNSKRSLVDEVQGKLMDYFRSENMVRGDAIPGEVELADRIGVARSVMREALSRFKMAGVIESRQRRGMVLCEPSLFCGVSKLIDPIWMSDDKLLDILELRCALEIGITDAIFRNLRDQDIENLRKIVNASDDNGQSVYSSADEFMFHAKLYEISGNKAISEFQEVLHSITRFVKEKFGEIFASNSAALNASGLSVTHRDLFGYIEHRDIEGYRSAIRGHFRIYTDYIYENR